LWYPTTGVEFHIGKKLLGVSSETDRGILSSGDGSDDEKGFFTGSDCVWQRGVRRFVGYVFRAGKKPQVRPALLRDVVADRSQQHGVSGLERVEDGALRDLTLDVKVHVAADARQRPQMRREHDSNQGSVWTSTESTAGRSRTIGAQLSPESADAYTCPPVVPKYTPHESNASTAMASRNTLT